MTKEQAILWVVGILGSVCAGAITLDKVLDIIHKYLKKAHAPDDAQDKRLDDLDVRLSALETGYSQHSAALNRDLQRFDELNDAIIINLKAIRAVLVAQLSGDNVDAMSKSAEEIDKFIFERKKTAWKQQ